MFFYFLRQSKYYLVQIVVVKKKACPTFDLEKIVLLRLTQLSVNKVGYEKSISSITMTSHLSLQVS